MPYRRVFSDRYVRRRLRCTRGLLSSCNAGLVLFVLAWFGFPLALPPQFTIIYALPAVCFLLVFLYGSKAVDFYYTGRVVVKPVISARALAALCVCVCTSVALALAWSPRLQPPPFPPTNVIRCELCARHRPHERHVPCAPESTVPVRWGSAPHAL